MLYKNIARYSLKIYLIHHRMDRGHAILCPLFCL